MTTIGEDIQAWARTNVQGSAVMTRNEDAYNHMQLAVQELLKKPWVQFSADGEFIVPREPNLIDTTT